MGSADGRKVWLKRSGLAVILLLASIQFFAIDRHNPVVEPSQTIYSTESPPAEVRSILQRSCNDCHSNETRWPWYSYIAPVSWVVANDVHQARRRMNFTEWGTYPSKKRADRLEEFCEQLMNGEMPDRKYTFIHRNARLTQEERASLCAWANGKR